MAAPITDASLFRRNFSPMERAFLIELVNSYIEVLENKQTNNVAVRLKQQAWNEIAVKFNSNTLVAKRTSKQLLDCYKNMKKRALRSGKVCGMDACKIEFDEEDSYQDDSILPDSPSNVKENGDCISEEFHIEAGSASVGSSSAGDLAEVPKPENNSFAGPCEPEIDLQSDCNSLDQVWHTSKEDEEGNPPEQHLRRSERVRLYIPKSVQVSKKVDRKAPAAWPSAQEQVIKKRILQEQHKAYMAESDLRMQVLKKQLEVYSKIVDILNENPSSLNLTIASPNAPQQNVQL